MSAAARAEARRKAILSRGSDRLAKLTTSARGEDASAYMHDDPPLPNLGVGLRDFVGEETNVNRSLRSSPTPPSFDDHSTHSDHPAWTPEQQQQLLRTLMSGGPMPSSFPSQPPNLSSATGAGFPPQTDDPLQAIMASFAQNGANSAGKAPAAPVGTKPATTLQRLLPLVHLVTMWSLLAYFVLWKEPELFEERAYSAVPSDGRWSRWAELGWKNAQDSVWGVQFVPFFWAFTTLQIVLHSLRIFSGFDSIQPPMLLSIALPHLPPPFPSLITSGLKYLQMGSLFLDDLAGLIFGFGIVIVIAGWISV